jgi:hypothetical protein
LKNIIHSYLKENSSVASNRIIKNKSVNWINPGNQIHARYLNDSKLNLFYQFPFKNNLSLSTFLKYLNQSGEFKKPHR